MNIMDKDPRVKFLPLTKEIWADFESLFGVRGACGGCWCMWWRLNRKQFEKQKGEMNKQAMKSIVYSGEVPGIILYRDNQPIGWCAVGPRDNYSVLERSRILARIDDKYVWSIVCFFIDKKYRDLGLSFHLIKAAIEYVKSQGGKIIEGYPVEPKKDKMPKIFAWTGFSSAFVKAGFQEVGRRSETRPIMRYYL